MWLTSMVGAADAPGLGDQLGSISVGKVADLVIFDGDLLEDPAALHKIVAVLKEGREVSGTLPNGP